MFNAYLALVLTYELTLLARAPPLSAYIEFMLYMSEMDWKSHASH